MKAILIDVIDPKTSREAASRSLLEIERLVSTYGGITVLHLVQKKQQPNYATYIGSGKLEELYAESLRLQADIVIINAILKPRQIYEVSKRFEKEKIAVWDRIDLILHIFSKHAVSSEAKLQIELAKIKHIGPRIYGLGHDLSRQGGGLYAKGSGETNTQMMKHHFAKEEDRILARLAEVKKRRMNQRKRRERNGVISIAIVGYTNAGKSALFQTLTHKKNGEEDALFATLDTKLTKFFLPGVEEPCVLSDTIGFIQNLPPTLIEAFASTLDEAIHADCILHVIDVSDPERSMQRKTTEDILEKLDALHIPRIVVYNKSDREYLPLEEEERGIVVSAHTSQGIEVLEQEIASLISSH